jgi:hypothetical protein
MATVYGPNTAPEVKHALALAEETQQRIRLWYGNPETGESFEVEVDNIGYVSTNVWGLAEFPVLVHNSRTDIGVRIPTWAIVKATVNGVMVYRHPQFSQPKYTVAADMVLIGEDIHRQFKSEAAAQRWVEWMYGKRTSLGGPTPGIPTVHID